MNLSSRSSRPPLLVLSLCLLTSAFRLPPSAFSAPDPLIPAPLAADRYKALAARSPFSPPTAETPPPVVAATPPPPGWGEKYTLGGVAQFGTGYKVTLNPKNPVGAGASASAGGSNVSPSERVIVVTGQPTPDGITLLGVQWGDDAKQTRATLIKNGVSASFNFDASALSAARGNTATAASVPAPRSSAGGPGFTPPGGASSSGFVPPAAPLPGGGVPSPGIVRSPSTRAPIRPPPAPTAANGQPFVAPPPPPVAPLRAAPLPAPALPGNVVEDDDD